MKKYMISVPVSARDDVSAAEVAKLVDQLLNIGLADAQATVEQGEGDLEAANAVLDLNIATPVPQDETTTLRLLADADSYLREIRAENLDGSEPALGELLDHITSLWISPPAELSMAERLAPLVADGLVIGDCTKALAEPDDNPFVRAARELLQGSDDVVLDDHVVISQGGKGAMVLTWTWVSNGEAGLLEIPELLERVLEQATDYLAENPDALPEEDMVLANVQADWLEDLIVNFSDELADVADTKPTGAPGPIVWVDGDVSHSFLPSEALDKLIDLAQQQGMEPGEVVQAKQFAEQFGEKLDAILTVIQTA